MRCLPAHTHTHTDIERLSLASLLYSVYYNSLATLRFDFATNYKAFSFIVAISYRRRNPKQSKRERETQLDNDLYIILVGYKFNDDYAARWQYKIIKNRSENGNFIRESLWQFPALAFPFNQSFGIVAQRIEFVNDLESLRSLPPCVPCDTPAWPLAAGVKFR